MDSFSVSPTVTRFNELKVGDKVKMTYYESLVFQVRKPGQKASGDSDEVAPEPRQGRAFREERSRRRKKRTVTVKGRRSRRAVHHGHDR